MLQDQLKKYKIILASGSPRRSDLLKNIGIEFEVRPLEIDESYPPSLKHAEIAVYLSELKAKVYDLNAVCENCLVITADTIVWLDDKILLKPVDYDDAVRILTILSGRMHEVITGVTLRTASKMKTFYSVTKVYFKPLSDEEIHWYITNYKPYDKAGAYGGQEWIGYVGIERIEGSYLNVVGLPVQKLYSELIAFVQ